MIKSAVSCLMGLRAYALAKGVSWPAKTGVLAVVRGGVWKEKTRFRVGVVGIGVPPTAEELMALEELRMGDDGREREVERESSFSLSSFESIVVKVALACSVLNYGSTKAASHVFRKKELPFAASDS